MELTPEEIALCARVGFDAEVARLLKSATGNAVEQAFCYDDELDSELTGALSSRLHKKSFDLDELRAALPRCYRVYLGVRRDSMCRITTTEAVVLRDEDPFAFVRFRKTNGCNYGLETEDVVAQLKIWHARFGLDILRADFDFVEMRFNSLPADIMGFVEEVYWFCEDVADVEAHPKLLKSKEELCQRALKMPDVSSEFRKRYEAAVNEVIKDYTLPNDFGLKMLAAQLERDRNLSLWWD